MVVLEEMTNGLHVNTLALPPGGSGIAEIDVQLGSYAMAEPYASFTNCLPLLRHT